MVAPQIAIPLALIGLGLIFLSGGSPEAHLPPLLSGPRMIQVHVLMGNPIDPYVIPIDISLQDIVAIFTEHRSGDENARDWVGKARLLMQRVGKAPEAFWIAESISDVMKGVGAPGDFIEVHLPSGSTLPRSAEEWSLDLEDEPSMDLVPLVVNQGAIIQIGPSPIAHYRRRRLGRIYTRDGCHLDLYESLDTLRLLVGPGVVERVD